MSSELIKPPIVAGLPVVEGASLPTFGPEKKFLREVLSTTPDSRAAQVVLELLVTFERGDRLPPTIQREQLLDIVNSYLGFIGDELPDVDLSPIRSQLVNQIDQIRGADDD